MAEVRAFGPNLGHPLKIIVNGRGLGLGRYLHPVPNLGHPLT